VDLTFRYDFNSPYAHLAIQRVGDLLPPLTWQPIAQVFVLRARGRTAWSPADAQRTIDICDQRAADRGLPALTWPAGWPADSYSLLPMRAATVAQELGMAEAFTREAFDKMWFEGGSLDTVAALQQIAARVGIDPELLSRRIDDPSIKDQLREATEKAIDAGVPGVPTVTIGSEHFWGDDRLDDAALAWRHRQ
jgi:2-hydroxychromene-2-carboxylate isomerase